MDIRKILKIKIIFTILVISTLVTIIILQKVNTQYDMGTEFNSLIGLLIVAYSALIVGYFYGIKRLDRGEWPIDILWMGVVSNIGAAVFLIAHLITGTFTSYGSFGDIGLFIWFVSIVLLAIGSLISYFGLYKDTFDIINTENN